MKHPSVTVIGSGTMGNGIAHVFAQSGRKVTLVDVNQAFLDRALGNIGKNLERQKSKGLLAEDPSVVLARIEASTDVGVAQGSTLAVEAIPERKALKQDLFKQLDEIMPDSAWNTTSMPWRMTKPKASQTQLRAGSGWIAMKAMKAGTIVAVRNTSDGARSLADAKPQRQPPMKPRITAPKRSRMWVPPSGEESKNPKVGHVPGSEKIIATA